MMLQRRLRVLIDSFTTYTVTLYSLLFLVASALILRAFNNFEYSTLSTLVLSLLVLVGMCFAASFALSKFYRLPHNQESAIITGIILFFVLAMPSTNFDYVGLALAAIIAMASKYLFTWRSSLIFNPAAIGAFIVSILGLGSAAWWISDPALIIPSVVVGFLMLYKLRRFSLFFAFFIPSFLLLVLRTTANDTSVLEAANIALTTYPLIFLGTVMLTEPLTLPSTHRKRLVYGSLIGIILTTTFSVGFLYASPLTALLIGNLFTFIMTYKAATVLTLVKKQQLTPTTYSFTFKPDKPLIHLPGQYIDLTLPGIKTNLRGNRRTFSIVSHSSTELIDIGVKFYENGSAYKQLLQKLKKGDQILATNINGEFMLPKTINSPIVMVAGGIGITPFISMLQEVARQGHGPLTTLYYFARGEEEVAYKSVLTKAKNAGVTVEIRSGSGARLDDATIKKHIHALFYLSGPPAMVLGYKQTLVKNGSNRIRTDYFTGY